MYIIDGQIDCGPEAEDEEDCELTDDMIKKMKAECEANTLSLSRHVMCPNTYICIKQDWLCGEFVFHEPNDVEKIERIPIYFQTETMIVTISVMKRIAEQKQTALKISLNA